MAISLNWINEYVDIKDVDLKLLADKITKSGINVEKVSTNNIENLVIGKVIECEDHPDSDHLHICKVDVGKEILQIICGAPNVRKDIKVIVALEGAVLPGDFQIKKGKIRGVESCGMICALFEIGLEAKTEESYSKGIYILPEDAPVGENALKYLDVVDTTYELDLNPNRTDCNNHICFAYEVAAVLHKEVKLPDTTFHEIDENIDNLVSLDVQTDNCSMYNLMIAKDVVIKPSPDFIRKRLEVSGVRSINNVVDISNYVMLEYGQPLHFFDKDLVGNKIIVRMAHENETIVTLDNNTRDLTTDDIVICNEDKALCIAGVMGGLNSGINENTHNILIESAIFNRLNVRYTSLRLNLRSEASLRFEKPLNYEYCNLAIQRACHLLEKYADAKIVKGKICYDKVLREDRHISVSLKEINQILGMNMTHEDVQNSLKGLGFEYTLNDEVYNVLVPLRRGDIVMQKEDLIEEVGRLYGYDNIEPKLPSIAIKKGEYSPFTKYRKDISKRLRSLGFNELRTYTLLSSNASVRYNYEFNESISLLRPMLKERSVVRQSLLSSIEDSIRYNLNKKQKDLMFYEIANTYSKVNEEFEEDTKLAFMVTGDYLNNTWNDKKYHMDFYFMKGIIENLLNYLGFQNRYTFKLSAELPSDIHPKINSEIFIDNHNIGYFGSLHPNVIKEEIYACEISLTKLFNYKTKPIKYKEINKYPVIEKDVAFIIDDKFNNEDIYNVIKKSGGRLLSKVTLFDIYRGNKINENEKSMAYKLTFEDNTRTLTEEEVMVIFNNVIEKVTKTFNATLRDK